MIKELQDEIQNLRWHRDEILGECRANDDELERLTRELDEKRELVRQVHLLEEIKKECEKSGTMKYGMTVLDAVRSIKRKTDAKTTT